MRLDQANPRRGARFHRVGSVLVVVLWIAAALISITLYFAHSMSLELRASDERAAGMAAEQAIEGGLRYVSMVITNYSTNGYMPSPTYYQYDGVQVGEARFWLIGRDISGQTNSYPTFGLVDEAGKLNLNTVDTNWLMYLTNMTSDFAAAIADWRSTNSSSTYGYGQGDRPYTDKNAPFETVDELMLVQNGSAFLVAGEDLNRNGILDPDERDLNQNGRLDLGIFEFATVYSREPEVMTNGTARTRVTQAGAVQTLLDGIFGQATAATLLPQPAGRGRGGGGRGGAGGGAGAGGLAFTSPLDVYVQSSMTAAQFAQVAPYLSAGLQGAQFTQGRVNVNTASAGVLMCLPGVDQATAQQLVSYRVSNPTALSSVAWVADALGKNSAAVTLLKAGDYITTFSYQFMADIAAVGPNGRGYRRTRFIIDTTTGTPVVVYRQDLTRLGWALGPRVRNSYLASNIR
jgi:DNA uptake protein ComE-like DNA-binding protein